MVSTTYVDEIKLDMYRVATKGTRKSRIFRTLVSAWYVGLIRLQEDNVDSRMNYSRPMTGLSRAAVPE